MLTDRVEHSEADLQASRQAFEKRIEELNATLERERLEHSVVEGSLEAARKDRAQLQRELTRLQATLRRGALSRRRKPRAAKERSRRHGLRRRRADHQGVRSKYGVIPGRAIQRIARGRVSIFRHRPWVPFPRLAPFTSPGMTPPGMDARRREGRGSQRRVVPGNNPPMPVSDPQPVLSVRDLSAGFRVDNVWRPAVEGLVLRCRDAPDRRHRRRIGFRQERHGALESCGFFRPRTAGSRA